MVTQGYTATLVAAALAISRSSLYYRKKPRGSRADRSCDEQIVVACGERLAYGYRRVAWWLQRKKGLRVNRKRVLRVMRERGLLVRSRRLRARRKKEWGRVEAAEPNQIWQSDMNKIWAGPAVSWAYLVSVIDCCTREIAGWNLSHRCRTEDALAAVEQAVLERLPQGSRGENLTLTTDNGTQFTSSRFLETLGRLGITHRRTAYHHPEGMVANLKAIKAELQRRKHHRTTEVGAWLRKVVLGYYRYHAVPGNSSQWRIFSRRVCWLWRSVLVRRSQRAQVRWDRLYPLLTRWIPRPRILHPYP
jgi:putative transposase